MSTRDLFGSKKILSSTNLEEKFVDIESSDNARQQIIKKNRFIPQIDFTSASNFAFFGSAEEYYRSAMENIADRYPYDGSLKERTEFLNSSSYIDLHILDNLYPRTNGYVIFSSDGWGSSAQGIVDGYGSPDDEEYISLRGTMNTASGGMITNPLASTFTGSNLYQSNIYSDAGVQALGRVGTRGNNLKLDPPQGFSVEFWLKKDAWITGSTNKEVVFDLWNGEASSSAGYGRFTLFLSGTSDGTKPWNLNAYSGTMGVQTYLDSGAPVITQTTATVADGNWHHYAFTFKNDSGTTTIKAYRDGTFADSVVSSILDQSEVTGALQARIGALITSPSGSAALASAGKLSASIDEFRYWKTRRTEEEIGKFYWSQVGGGTNTDIANTELGVYYKFNEGITTNTSTDSVVLDYSGRITNGIWVGYPGSTARNTGSAMVLSGKATKEFKDPIVYKTHADYISTLNSLITSGTVHDDQNSSYLYRTLPAWIVDEDEDSDGNVKKLMQIMGNTFDQFYLQTKEYNRFQNVSYGIPTAISASVSGSKTFPYNDRILQSYGFDTDEVFIDQTFLEYFANRNENREFDLDINEVKNQIYKHIYNNLIYLYKSKGTEKSVRNLLRCIGLPESVLKLNAHSNNNTFAFENRFVNNTEKKKYINFYNSTTFDSTIFQSASSNANTRDRSYISGTMNNRGAFTSEVNVVFPRKLEAGDPGYFETSFITSSIFGLHIATDADGFDWPSVASDDKNFQLQAIRPDKNSKDAYFAIINRGGTTLFTSSLYKEVYDNNEWTFAASVYNDKFGYAGSGSDAISGSTTVQHKLSLRGYNTEGYYIKNSFELVSNLTDLYGTRILTSSKRYYIGANRENYSGTVQEQTDVKVGYLRHYNTLLDNETISVHARDRQNFGISTATRNEFLLRGQTAAGSYIPAINLLELNIDFEKVTGSDSGGNFLVVDFSSGSTGTTEDIRNLYPEIGTNVATQYEFTGYSFPSSSTGFVKNEPMLGADFQTPEIVYSSEMINALSRDDELFTKDPRIFSMNFALEKSYNAVVTKQMLDFFGSIRVFNDVIGEVAANYRNDYDKLEVLRTLFFDKITSLTDLNKFYEYYKWIDDSILNFVRQLLPESANFENNVRNLIESHLLERNKIRYQYPILDYKGNRRFVDPTLEARVRGIKTLDYNWKFGHAVPGSVDQGQNTLWWDRRAKASDPGNTSGDTTVDNNRQRFNLVENNVSTKLISTLRDNSGNKYYVPDNTSDSTILTSKIEANKKEVQIHGGLNSNFAKNIGIFRNRVASFHDVRLTEDNKKRIWNLIEGWQSSPSGWPLTDNQVFPSDDSELNTKPKRSFSTYIITPSTTTPEYKTEFIFPGTIVSSSVETGYQTFNVGKTVQIGIQNMHLDIIDSLDISMQGPYTEAHVGGLQWRHQDMNRSTSDRSLDTIESRAEGFKISYTSYDYLFFAVPQAYGSDLNTYNADLPYATRIRDEHAKRPVSIKNIKTTTGSFILGNYQRASEILLLSGRDTNNHVFVYNDGFSTNTGSIVSTYITGAADYTKIVRSRHRGEVLPDQAAASTQHVIVSRFSAPGGPEVAGDNQGGAGLDWESAEFSPYNNLNYRNLSVRRPFNRAILPNHSNYGGFFSSGSDGYPGIALGNSNTVTSANYLGSSSLYGVGNATASFYKINRNPRRVAYQTSSVDFSTGTLLDPGRTKKVYDNAYVASNIPGSEFQYAWITASYISSNILSYQSQDGFVSTSAGRVDEITFLSASELGSAMKNGDNRRPLLQNDYTSGFVPTDFAGINTTIVEPTDASSFTLGYSLSFDVLGYYNWGKLGEAPAINTISTGSFLQKVATRPEYSGPGVPLDVQAWSLNNIITHRNGPYGYPTWKQIRVGQGQLGRHYRKNNLFTYTPQPGNIFTNDIGQVLRNKFGATVIFTQSVLTSKYPPIEVSIDSIDGDTAGGHGVYTNNQLFAEHGNEKIYLSRESDNLKLDLKNNNETALDLVNNLYIQSQDGDFVAKEMIYKEIVWPREENIYLAKVRQRAGFRNNFWRDTAENRQLEGASQKNISAVRSGFGMGRSSWDLDVYPEFSDFAIVFKDTDGSTGRGSPVIINEDPFGYSGILQNYTTFNRYDTKSNKNVTASILRVEPTYNRPQMVTSIRSVVSLNGIDIELSGGLKISDFQDGAANKLNESFIGSGQAKWETGDQAGKTVSTASSDGSITTNFVISPRKPFYDSYEEYAHDISIKAKDYTIIPEYRRSDFIGKDNDVVNLADFARIVQSTSSITPINSSQNDFYTVFSNTDFMKYFEVIRGDVATTDGLINDTFTLRCNAYKKFLPYNGFYPAERTVEIAQQFFKSYEGSFETTGGLSVISDTNQLRPVLQTLFAPGILYNTIKSGLAVDYPIFTASYNTVSRNLDRLSTDSYTGLSSSFSARLPFEAIYEPENYLDKLTIVDNEPMSRASIISNTSDTASRLRNKINLITKNNLYTYMINNFLAETQDFFLANRRPTRILSKPEDEFGTVRPGEPYGMRIRMYRSLDTLQPISGSWGDFPVPQLVPPVQVKPPLGFIYLNMGLVQGTPTFGGVHGDREGLCSTNPAAPDTDLNWNSDLTASFYFTGSDTGAYTLTGSSLNTNDSTAWPGEPTTGSFQLATESSGLGLHQLETTMTNLASVINLNTNYKATYEGPVFIDWSDIIDTSVAKDACAEGVYGEFGVVRVEGTDLDDVITLEVSESSSPNSTDGLNEFFFVSNTLLTDITEVIAAQTDSTQAALTASFTIGAGSIPRENFTMYSRPTAFGPPVSALGRNTATTTVFSGAYDSHRGYNTAFTPPYYYGESWMDIIFLPHGTSFTSASMLVEPYKPSLSVRNLNENALHVFPDPNIQNYLHRQDGMFTKNWRFDKEAGVNPGTDLIMRDGNVNSNSMQLDASIDAFKIIEDENGKKRWSIELKYETPMLNFAHLAEAGDVYYPNGELSASVPRGMWHQFGKIPDEKEGVYLQVGPIPANWLDNHPSGVIGTEATLGGVGLINAGNAYGVYRSNIALNDYRTLRNSQGKNPWAPPLSEICGFPSEPVRLGEISRQKKVSEAIVAIPFVEVDGNKDFFKIDRDRVDTILNIMSGKDITVQLDIGDFDSPEAYETRVGRLGLDSLSSTLTDEEKSRLLNNSVGQQIQKMSKYNFPPQFDCITFEDQEPIAMYLFEFEHTFDRDDLSHIWQNVMPELGVKFEKAQAEISHPLLSDELLGKSREPGDISNFYIDLPTNLKWMVFKVKQKAKTDYKKVLGRDSNLNLPVFNYNWPYDFFSMVELAQLESSVGFSSGRTSGLTDTRGMIVTAPEVSDTAGTMSRAARQKARGSTTIIEDISNVSAGKTSGGTVDAGITRGRGPLIRGDED